MATNPLGLRPYYGILSGSITTKQSVMDLLIAAYAALTPAQAIPPLTGAQVNLYAIAANGVTVLIGDSNLSTTVYARVLPASTATFLSEANYGPFETSDIPLQDIYVMADDGGTGVKIGIEVIVG